MLTGPADTGLSFPIAQWVPEEKADIVSYVRHASEARSPGGYGLGGLRTDL